VVILERWVVHSARCIRVNSSDGLEYTLSAWGKLSLSVWGHFCR
jgi:hypothetical protein